MKRLVDRLKGNVPQGNTCVVIYKQKKEGYGAVAEVFDVMTGEPYNLVYMARSLEAARKEIKAAGYKVQEFRDLFSKGNVSEMWYQN